LTVTFDEVADHALELACQQEDYSEIRRLLREIGYPLPPDDNCEDLIPFLPTALTKNLTKKNIEHIGNTIGLDGCIRRRSMGTLRLLLNGYGHKVQSAEELAFSASPSPVP